MTLYFVGYVLAVLLTLLSLRLEVVWEDKTCARIEVVYVLIFCLSSWLWVLYACAYLGKLLTTRYWKGWSAWFDKPLFTKNPH